ncbi:MAG: hypothetical protein GY850_39630, partial [bacterium]|nr:hypothetical protein [bacterium]
MILITSDTHCYYGCVNQQIEHVESQGISVSSVIHLGDFGIYRDKLYDFFIRKQNRFLRPVYFIEGNHEDFQGLEAITKKYAEYFTHLPRGTAHEIDGYRFLCLGGAE